MYPLVAVPLYLNEKDNPSIDDLYESVQEKLRDEMVGPVEGWPNVDIRSENSVSVIQANEWKERDPSNGGRKKLLEVHIELGGDGYILAGDFRLGQTEVGQVVLYNEWQSSSYVGNFPLTGIPFLEIFDSYSCRNEDGLLAGRTYVVSEERVEYFVEFLESSERRLPVVLVSCLRDDSSYPLADTTGLARKVQGLAHVIKLETHRAARALRSVLPNHGCYGGAVRIFWPNFSREDVAEVYPFWHPRRVEAAGKDLHADVFEKLTEQAPKMIPGNAAVEDLERRRAAEQEDLERQRIAEQYRQRLDRLKREIATRESRLRQQRDQGSSDTAALKEQIETLKSDQKDWDELFADYEELKRENDALRTKNYELREKVRSLNSHLNRARVGGEQARAADHDEPDDACSIYLSSKARKRYERLAADEREYWDRNILTKLLKVQMRENQSVPLPGDGEACWVYPRSGTAGGRRLIYYTTGRRINVCEILTKHEGRYEQLREQGVDRGTYEGFENWSSNTAR